ncbi:tyrosine-protein phosphatase [Gordonia sp. CPCC 205515]|uniref:tyrosine-protein phosphatase n=1 Tax=Gordonia sp. CPCC 205515 TaxID=3140791 RepID=UPI003AF36686
MTIQNSALRRRLAGALAAAAIVTTPAVVAPAVAAAAPAPAPAPAPTATRQLIDLQGTDNTRTFSAYRTTDGKSIRNNVVRSDNLSRITPTDQQTLKKLKVTSIVDLRTSLESSLQPDKPVPGATLHHFDVLGATPPTTLIDLQSAYRAFITDPQARQAFRNTLLNIKNTTAAGNTALFHCTAGKDRTGWTAATLLTILGVDRKTVNADYLASNVYRHASPNDPLNGVNISLLNASFDTANQKYGSFDNYVHKGLGLTDADIASLKKSLLTDSGNGLR